MLERSSEVTLFRSHNWYGQRIKAAGLPKIGAPVVSCPANQVSGSATSQPLCLEMSGWDGTEFPNSSCQVGDGLW